MIKAPQSGALSRKGRNSVSSLAISVLIFRTSASIEEFFRAVAGVGYKIK